MPNKPIFRHPRTEPKKEWSPRNGWMAWIHGAQQSQGSKALGPAGPDVKSPQFVEMEVAGLGRTRVRYETWSYTAHRSRYWAWSAVWADKLDAEGNVIAPT